MHPVYHVHSFPGDVVGFFSVLFYHALIYPLGVLLFLPMQLIGYFSVCGSWVLKILLVYYLTLGPFGIWEKPEGGIAAKGETHILKSSRDQLFSTRRPDFIGFFVSVWPLYRPSPICFSQW